MSYVLLHRVVNCYLCFLHAFVFIFVVEEECWCKSFVHARFVASFAHCVLLYIIVGLHSIKVLANSCGGNSIFVVGSNSG